MGRGLQGQFVFECERISEITGKPKDGNSGKLPEQKLKSSWYCKLIIKDTRQSIKLPITFNLAGL